VPFGSVVIPVGVFLGIAFARRAERRDFAHGREPWDRRRKMKYAMFWSLAVSTLLTECCLPFPLYLYSVITQPPVPRGYQWVADRDWRDRVIAQTPGFVKSAVHYTVSQCGWSTIQRWRTRIVDQGELPSCILWSYIGSPVQTERQRAWSRLWETSPSALLGVALRIVQGQDEAPAYTQEEAGHLVGIRGSDRDLRSILHAARNRKLPGFVQLVTGIVFRRDRDAFADDLFGLALVDGVPDKWVLFSLAHLGAKNRVKELWMGRYDAPDVKATRFFARALYQIQDEDLYEELTASYLRHPDLIVRRETIWTKGWQRIPCPLTCQAKVRWILRLLVLMDDEDGIVSRSAVYALGALIHGPQGIGCLQCPGTPEGSMPPLSLAEMEEREKVRAAAKEWLAKQEKRVTGGG